MISKGLRLLLPILVMAGLVFYPSCTKDDQDMEAVITVKYLGDTARVVPGAWVTLSKNTINEGGVTDAYGQYRHKFKLEAILDVTASIDTGMDGTISHLTGSTVIRLKPGRSEHRTVYVGL